MRIAAATLIAAFGVLVGAPVAGASGGLLNGLAEPLTGGTDSTASGQSTEQAPAGALAPVVQTVAPVVQTAAGTVAPVTQTATDAVAPVTQTAAPVVQTVTETAAPVVQTAVDAATPVVEPITTAAAPVVQGVTRAVAPVTKPLDEALAPVTEPVTRAVEPVVQAAKPLVEAAAPIVDGARPVVETVVPVTKPGQSAHIAGTTTTIAPRAASQHVSQTQGSAQNQQQTPVAGNDEPPAPPSSGLQAALNEPTPTTHVAMPGAHLGRPPFALSGADVATGAPALELPLPGSFANVDSRPAAQRPEAGQKSSSRPQLPLPSLPDVPWGALSAAAGGAGGPSSAIFAALAAALLLVLPRLGPRLSPALAPRPRPGFRPLLERPG